MGGMILPNYMKEHKRGKYGAQRTEYGARIFASKREASYAQELDLRVRAGDLASWEAQIPFDLVVADTKVCRYIIDFKEVNKDGTIIYTEVKGWWTPEAKLKVKLFKALFPDLKYQVVR